jgi:hypothetical protein
MWILDSGFFYRNPKSKIRNNFYLSPFVVINIGYQPIKLQLFLIYSPVIVTAVKALSVSFFWGRMVKREYGENP